MKNLKNKIMLVVMLAVASATLASVVRADETAQVPVQVQVNEQAPTAEPVKPIVFDANKTVAPSEVVEASDYCFYEYRYVCNAYGYCVWRYVYICF